MAGGPYTRRVNGVEEESVDPWWAGKASWELKTSIRLQ